MTKETITEGLRLLDIHNKAAADYKQTYIDYMNWYCSNMPKRAIMIHKISQFATDYIIPIVSLIGLVVGFAFGYHLGSK